MATFLYSVAALAALVQAPPPSVPSPSDSLAALRERVARDSTDGAGWLLVGRGYLQLAERSEEHTSELQSQSNLVCRLLLEKKKMSQLTHPELLPSTAHLIPVCPIFHFLFTLTAV